MHDCVLHDRPVVVTMKLRVLANKAQGVAGGYNANVVFVFNGMPSAWHGE